MTEIKLHVESKGETELKWADWRLHSQDTAIAVACRPSDNSDFLSEF